MCIRPGAAYFQNSPVLRHTADAAQVGCLPPRAIPHVQGRFEATADKPLSRASLLAARCRCVQPCFILRP
eukprot:15430174-Alexandrium_andersonii.AAC.1